MYHKSNFIIELTLFLVFVWCVVLIVYALMHYDDEYCYKVYQNGSVIRVDCDTFEEIR